MTSPSVLLLIFPFRSSRRSIARGYRDRLELNRCTATRVRQWFTRRLARAIEVNTGGFVQARENAGMPSRPEVYNEAYDQEG